MENEYIGKKQSIKIQFMSSSERAFSSLRVIKLHLPGKLVPNATKTIAVTESLIPSVQPKCDATSPITAVTIPIEHIDTKKHK